MLNVMYGVQHKDIKWVEDAILIVGLNISIDQLAMECNEHLYDHVLRRAMNFEVEGKIRKEIQKVI